MITHIVIQFLGMGEIPIFDKTSGEHRVYIVNDTLNWQPTIPRGHRFCVPLVFDSDIPRFKEDVARLVESASCLDESADGILIFSFRTLARAAVGDLQNYVCAGMAYTPRALEYTYYGQPLNGADPVELINHLCEGRRRHPIVREVLRQQAEDRRQHQEYWRRTQAESRRQKAELRAGNRKALKLLKELLTREQRRELVKEKRFHIQGQDGNTYRITTAEIHNVFQIDGDRIVKEFCIVTRGLPFYDQMLAQKLLLETNIDEFMRIANKWEIAADGSRTFLEPVLDLGEEPERTYELGEDFQLVPRVA